MESLNQSKNLLLFFVRHGERLDDVKTTKKPKIEFDFDPPLSETGKQQALQAGKNIHKYIESQGFSDAPIKYISSPFIRTLQTASYL